MYDVFKLLYKPSVWGFFGGVVIQWSKPRSPDCIAPRLRDSFGECIGHGQFILQDGSDTNDVERPQPQRCQHLPLFIGTWPPDHLARCHAVQNFATLWKQKNLHWLLKDFQTLLWIRFISDMFCNQFPNEIWCHNMSHDCEYSGMPNSLWLHFRSRQGSKYTTCLVLPAYYLVYRLDDWSFDPPQLAHNWRYCSKNMWTMMMMMIIIIITRRRHHRHHRHHCHHHENVVIT